MSCNNEGERQVWLVSSFNQEFTTPARCQLEAWDNIYRGRSLEELAGLLGVVASARPVESGEDKSIAIHSVGLLLRYGFAAAAEDADALMENAGLGRVLDKYRRRPNWVLV